METPCEIELVYESKGFSPMNFINRIGARYQHLLDRCTPHTFMRWFMFVVYLAIYMIRSILLQGWYIVTYALGIYLLNIFIAFLTPKVDPALRSYYEDDEGELPTNVNEEFRPFMRRLSEFKFWYSAMKATTVAMFCTFFELFNIPVFWPILVMYFILLFFVTMKKQILHMIKYRYVPFSFGKMKYAGKEDNLQQTTQNLWLKKVKIIRCHLLSQFCILFLGLQLDYCQWFHQLTFILGSLIIF